MGTIKSGWLLKLSGFFKNSWKKRYFTLYKDGEFCYYQGPGDKEADGKIHMKIECRRIDKGHAVGEGVKAPSNISINAIFSVASPERTWFLCAETEAECSEWISALEEARKPLGFQAGAGSAMPPYQQPAPGAPPPYPGPPMTGAAGVPPYPTQPPPQGAPSPYPPQATMPYPGQVAPGPYPQQPPMPYPPQPSSYPSQPYPQQPPQQYPPQPAGYAPPAPGYAPPPGQYPRQQYYAPGTNVVQGVRPQQPQTVYVQDSSGKNSSKKNMLMGAAGGAVGGMALGYMMGSAMGGGHHYHGWGGGWDSDHSWSSGGSFDCDFD